MEEVKITLDGQEYLLLYNESTEYYEVTITAPEATGLHVIDIEYRDTLGLIETAQTDLIVLKNQDEGIRTHEAIAYFLDKRYFNILDVLQVNIQEINRDLETNGNSIFTSARKLNVEKDDFIYLKKGDEISFIGLIKGIQNEDGTNSYQITCKDILSLLEFQDFIKQEELIKTTGIEDYIKTVIERKFISNTDTFLNKTFFEIEINTHTKINISVSSLVDVQDNLYNFLTFVNNTIEKYELQFNFTIDKNTLKLVISKREEEKQLIDTTVSDIINYSEVFSTNVTAKVSIHIKETNAWYYRYLKTDRTTTANQNDPDRAYGNEEIRVVENAEDAEQTSIDIFKGNSYQHMISFSVYKKSKIYDVKKLTLGSAIQIKTENNIIHDTYISKINDDDSNFITLTCGNLRINIIDKLLKERRN